MPQPQSYSWNIVDDTTPPYLVQARAPDTRHLDVIFSEPVIDYEALNPANYVITGAGGLAVSAVVKIDTTTYRLTTDRQTAGGVYTVTASNIHDLAGNLI